MNFSAVPYHSWIGKALRFLLRLLPPETTVPVLQGRLRGKRWIVGSSNHGCWLGSYEYEKRRAFERTISEGNVVFDVGAHVGFYTLLASVLVGPAGSVVAFEPVPRNLSYLREHLRLNQVTNVDVVACAVLGSTGVAWFEDGVDSSSGWVSAGGQVQVRTISLDEYVETEKARVPNCIKIDVEGSEWSVLRGAMSILKQHHPAIFLATHGRPSHDRCCETLRALGYDVYPIGGESVEQTDELFACQADESLR